jgi:hypothetical protein
MNMSAPKVMSLSIRLGLTERMCFSPEYVLVYLSTTWKRISAFVGKNLRHWADKRFKMTNSVQVLAVKH